MFDDELGGDVRRGSLLRDQGEDGQRKDYREGSLHGGCSKLGGIEPARVTSKY